MLKNIAGAVVLLISSFAVLAADTSGSMRWSENIPAVCGIRIDSGDGGIAFKNSNGDAARPSTFSIQSNVSLSGDKGRKRPGAYVAIEITDQSANLSDVTDSQSVFTVKGNGADQGKIIKDWKGDGKSMLPAGDYQSWLWVDKSVDDMEAGEAYMTTTITVSCDNS